MISHKPHTIIKLLKDLLEETVDSNKGQYLLNIKTEFEKIITVDDSIITKPYLSNLVRLAVRDYLNSDFDGDSKNQIHLAIQELEKYKVYYVS